MQALSSYDAERLLESLPSWQLDKVGACHCLLRSFSFKNFAAAMAFAQRVADLAGAADHHPELVISWGRVVVRWWTHEVGGLHAKDFACAAKTNECYD